MISHIECTPATPVQNIQPLQQHVLVKHTRPSVVLAEENDVFSNRRMKNNLAGLWCLREFSKSKLHELSVQPRGTRVHQITNSCMNLAIEDLLGGPVLVLQWQVAAGKSSSAPIIGCFDPVHRSIGLTSLHLFAPLSKDFACAYSAQLLLDSPSYFIQSNIEPKHPDTQPFTTQSFISHFPHCHVVASQP